MRSRHTGHVGSSTSEGVGGAKGLVVRGDASAEDFVVDEVPVETGTDTSVFEVEGVKGSFVISGNDVVPEAWPGVWNSTDLMKTT